ncbi:hypothetical protein KIOSHI_161 [Bacillus phage Kioshi]|nr:hypothetical protein KIOSHI_161 [Bacillus phage Kioshi]
MKLEDKIKKQNELEDQIAKLKDESYDLGREIMDEFRQLPEDKIIEYYGLMNSENDSVVKFDIFKEIILPNKEKLRGYVK